MTRTDAERERLANMRDACQAAIDGKPWEVQNTLGVWRDPDANSVPLNYWMARAKPLPSAPVVRPWRFEEAPLILRMKHKNGGYLAVGNLVPGGYLVHYDPKPGTCTVSTFEAVLAIFTQLDGTPCGTVAQTPDPRA